MNNKSFSIDNEYESKNQATTVISYSVVETATHQIASEYFIDCRDIGIYVFCIFYSAKQRHLSTAL